MIMTDASISLKSQFGTRMKGPSLIIWLSAISVWCFIIWAAYAWVDEIVRADGELISSSRPQIIQNLEGGILAELKVAEGDVVNRGDILARLHDTKFQSSVDDLQDQIAALEIRRLRLEAELHGALEFSVPDEYGVEYSDLVASERALLEARQLDFMSRRDGAQKVLDQAKNETNLLENMLTKKVVALIEVTRARKTLADAQIRLDEIITGTGLERANQYSDVLKELSTLKQNLKASKDQLNRTILRSPMRGVVNNLAVTTIGGVVRPGEEILEIIPLDDDLFVEARVKPKDIANIRSGQSATIKLTAYDYTIYGTLKGYVDVVSADTFKDENSRSIDGDPHYKVRIIVDRDNLTSRQARIEIRPGMQAQAELQTGAKSVLQYLLKPLYNSKDALRER